MSARAWLTAVSILVAAPVLAQETPTATAQNPAAQVPPIQQQVTPTPPDFPGGRISGYAFGDLYYNLAGDPNHHYCTNVCDPAVSNSCPAGMMCTMDSPGVRLCTFPKSSNGCSAAPGQPGNAAFGFLLMMGVVALLRSRRSRG